MALVKVGVWERDGVEFDLVEEGNPSTDLAQLKGVAFEGSSSTTIEGDSGVMKFKDSDNPTPVTLKELKDGADLAVVGRYVIPIIWNGTVSDGTFYGYSNLLPGDNTPISIVRDSVFKDFSWSNSNSGADFALIFRKNSTTATPFYTTPNQTNKQTLDILDVDESFNAGDKIYIEHDDQGGNASDVGMMLFFQNV